MSTLLFETGYRKPPRSFTLADRNEIVSLLTTYHCLIKVKAEVDQFIEGLKVLNVDELVRKHPNEMKPFFLDGFFEPLTAGEVT